MMTTESGDTPTSGERLQAAEQRLEESRGQLDEVGDRIAEAKEAAADVAERENVSEDERQAAADDVAGDEPEPGAEVAPG
jgi:septal ring factor EnvC (AmiA/AmiB activator)